MAEDGWWEVTLLSHYMKVSTPGCLEVMIRWRYAYTCFLLATTLGTSFKD